MVFMRDAHDTFVEWHASYASQHEEDPLCTCPFGAYTSFDDWSSVKWQ